MHRPIATILILIAILFNSPSLALSQDKPAYPPPPPPTSQENLGAGVQRTMTLLATSTPQHRNKVRILVYGQSISEQDWWKRLADDLRKRFPNADLEIENRAIGGFASQMLIFPAEHDLYPFYPDLLIFHVYGANQQYEQIIASTRSRTTAEVLVQKDHVTRWPPDVPDEKADKGMWWDHMMNNVFLPDIARKYACALCDIRSPWLEYLKANKLQPKALLKDDVHLNDHGNNLMAALIGRYLVHRPDLPDDPWKDLVRTAEVANDLSWQNGKLLLEFEGNRVDLLAAQTTNPSAQARVLIDGIKPSQFPGCYRITRPSPGPWSPLTVARIDHDAPLVIEDWTLRITSVGNDGKQWAFEVAGSITGPDGDGSNEKTFVSKSGRVKIEPAAFFRAGEVTVGYEIKWKVLPMFVDTYQAMKADDPAREYATTVAQGLPNEKHTLELVADGPSPPPIRAIRICRPPVRPEPPPTPKP